MRAVLTLALIASTALATAATAQGCNEKACPNPDQGVAAANQAKEAQTEAALQAERQRQDAEWADRQARIDGEQQAYQDRLAATQAEADRRNREYEAQMEQWRRRVAACQAGDRSQCAQPN